jgi:AcrR family transcriptional regulator
MAREGREARARILGSAAALLREFGAETLTIERTARRAGVAKGLVHYHFKTKQGLLQAALTQVCTARCTAWKEAFEADSPTSVVDQTWALLVKESATGVLRAWHSLTALDSLVTDQTARVALAQFSQAVGDALSRMLDRSMALAPRVPASELGWLLAAVVNGVGTQLMAGTSGSELEGAYAAAWLGILSLTQPQD